MEKDFDKWNVVKKKLDLRKSTGFINEREIWWCSLGVNLGHEEDGKNERFERPVLVIKKTHTALFYGLPLSTKGLENPSKYAHVFKDRKELALLGQLRILSSSRFLRRMRRMGRKEFGEIKEKLKNLL